MPSIRNVSIISSSSRYIESLGTPTRRRYKDLNVTCTWLLVTFMFGVLPESVWSLLVCEEFFFQHSPIPT
ncbi:unnamed protein product, partial [Allacma fusca]